MLIKYDVPGGVLRILGLQVILPSLNGSDCKGWLGVILKSHLEQTAQY